MRRGTTMDYSSELDAKDIYKKRRQQIRKQVKSLGLVPGSERKCGQTETPLIWTQPTASYRCPQSVISELHLEHKDTHT